MSKPVSSTIRQHSSYETDSESDSIVSTASSSEQDSTSENDSGKSPKAPVMKVRQAPDTVPTMPAMAKANMAPPSPTLTNKQVIEQKRAQYGQARHLPAYQRDTNINKIKTIKQDAIADIQQPTKHNPAWERFSGAITNNGTLHLDYDFIDMRELSAWLGTSPASLCELSISRYKM